MANMQQMLLAGGGVTVYDGTITQGFLSDFSNPPYSEFIYGFAISAPGVFVSFGSFGSRSPTTLTTGITLHGAFFRVLNDGVTDISRANGLSLSGFASDPGANYVSSASREGVRLFTSAAAYTYDSINNIATWQWDVTGAIDYWAFTNTGTCGFKIYQ